LPVAISRTYTVTDGRNKLAGRLPFGDWDINLPYIGGSYLAATGCVGSMIPHSNPAQYYPRCSVSSVTQVAPPDHFSTVHFHFTDYWNGLQMNIPGRGSQDVLFADNYVSDRPTDHAGPWRWRRSTRSGWARSSPT
jgi:hypothetical protein